ncbi:uncharacterized protein LOC6612591 [Drosophila sechellia]|uniref:GM12292 n=1 Tax=Drosophila sechellia TaxID=7238 RepID=B4HYZ8_DROSE|nr:uncharacterized protein LOC6612591 [Drosophila sechellia]EDW53255.1 GM12292 [Drosophila sechellia]
MFLDKLKKRQWNNILDEYLRKTEQDQETTSAQVKNELGGSNKLLTPNWYWYRYIDEQIVPLPMSSSLVQVAESNLLSPISNLRSKLCISVSSGLDVASMASRESIKCPPPPVMFPKRVDADFSVVLTISRQRRFRNKYSSIRVAPLGAEPSQPRCPDGDPILRAGRTFRDYEVIWRPMSAKLGESWAENILRSHTGQMSNNEIMWKAIKMCWFDDLEIQIESRFLFVSRIVFTHFARNFRKLSSPFLQIPVQKIEMAILARIYEWMLDEEESFLVNQNLLAFYAAAYCLGVKPLMKQAWNIISSNEDYDIWEISAFRNYIMARDFRCQDIMAAMLSRLRKSFLPIVASWEFLEFDVNEVTSLLEQDMLCVNSEDEIFFAAFHWLDYSWAERKKFAAMVMQKVRFALLSPWLRRSICNVPENDRIGEIAQIPEIWSLIWEGTLLCQVIIALGEPECRKSTTVRRMLKDFEEKTVNERNWVFCEGVPHHHDRKCARYRELTYESFKRFLHRLHNQSVIFMNNLQLVPNRITNTYCCCIDVNFCPDDERTCPMPPFYREHLDLDKKFPPYCSSG